MAVKPLTSALKIFDVLDVVGLSPKPLRLADVVKATGGQRAAIHQRLLTLVQGGLLEQLEDGRYRLGWRIVRYAASANEQANFGARIADILQAVMVESGETASFSVLDGTAMVIIQRVESRGILRQDLRVGALLALRPTASGRVMVAFASERVVAGLEALGAEMPEPEIVEDARRRGYALSAPLGPRTVAAVAVPVRDQAGECVGALAISGPTTGFDSERNAAIALKAAAAIEMRFRGDHP
jgi:IclR family transcriptional regulator, acetate operon repressor